MTNTDLIVATVAAALILAYLISTILNKDRRKETDVMPQAPFSSDRLKEATEKLQQFKIAEKEETNDEQNPLLLQCAYERGREDQKREFKEYLEKEKAELRVRIKFSSSQEGCGSFPYVMYMTMVDRIINELFREK